MIFKLINILLCVYYVSTQTTICPPVNNAPAVEPCPSTYSTYCKNSGYCVILFGSTLSCTCPVGFTGTYCEINQNVIVTPATTTFAPITFTTTAGVSLCPAAQQVCLNGGQCLILSANNFICSCPPQFTGVLCETSIGIATTTAPVTSCPAGLVNVCQNGGTCLIINNNNVFCSCRTGFTGDLCEKSTVIITTQSPITPAPSVADCPTTIRICQNGGRCLILNGVTVTCSCPTGYSGNYCEILSFATTTAIMITNPSVTVCPVGTAVTCLNGGQCLLINGVNIFCSCPTGWTGTRCETFVTIVTTTVTPIVTTPAVSYCPTGISPCLNGGICLILNGKDVICSCLTGFSGTLCEISAITAITTTTPAAVASCPSTLNICLNGGQCLVLRGVEFICSCINGFSGTLCEISPATTTTATTTVPVVPVALCQAAVNICQNGGQCLIIDGTTLVCTCLPGFTGVNCQQTIAITTDPCQPNPCQNNAICLPNNVGLARCLCTQAFTGTRCEIPI